MTLRIIAGKYKGRLLNTPKGQSTRPTQSMLREAVFNICMPEIENATVLDLFAGSGAIGFEALSRGASHATFVESDKRAIQCIRKNMETLDVKAFASLIALPVEKALKRLCHPFDIIYIDPPYAMSSSPILEELLANHLLKTGTLVFLEERYEPRKKKEPFAIQELLLKGSRRFGEALLHQYVYQNNLKNRKL